MNNTNLNSQNTATQNFDEKAFALLIPIFLIALVTLAILFVPFDDVSGTDGNTAKGFDSATVKSSIK